MKAWTWQGIARGLCVVVAAWAGTASADDALTPRMKQTRAIIDSMIDPKGVLSMTLSPDGKYIAAITWSGHVRNLMLIDTDTQAARVLVAAGFRMGWSQRVAPTRAQWISNTALAVDFNNGESLVVGLDGGRGIVLGDRFVRMIAPENPAEPAQWAIVGEEGLFHSTQIRRVHVATGEKVEVPIGLPGDLVHAVFDPRGRLRAATTLEDPSKAQGAKFRNWYRHDEHTPWQQLAQASIGEDLWQPIGVPDDTDKLVVLSRDGRDTWAMYRYDIATRQVDDLRVGHPTEDLIDFEEDAGQDLIRVTTHGLKPSTYWFDARWDRLQRSVDAALPEAVNVLQGDPKGKVLVKSSSDREPGRWLILDTTSMTLREVARRRPGLAASAMRPMQPLSYSAEDGLTIPAYLTLPEGPTQPRPLVVVIHGGPVHRDEWEWDQRIQVLAAAGYAVLQPQFRGSEGFGRRFEQAGYRQWGLAMQDDITAGVRAMIARGVADPERICVFGASYGGYAALWGLVKTPGLYQCGISLAGVTDIGEMLTDWSDTNASKFAKEWQRFAVGDLGTMAAQFDAVSPQKHAGEIRVPVMLAHGGQDERVPIGHSRRMAAALRAANIPVETHWYADEAHGLYYTEDVRDFTTALVDFLDRHIGPASRFAGKTPAKTAEAAGAASTQH